MKVAAGHSRHMSESLQGGLGHAVQLIRPVGPNQPLRLQESCCPDSWPTLPGSHACGANRPSP